MAKMMGNATRYHRQGGRWWYCCPGHDGLWKHYIKKNRKSQRAREKRATAKEIRAMEANWS